MNKKIQSSVYKKLRALGTVKINQITLISDRGYEIPEDEEDFLPPDQTNITPQIDLFCEKYLPKIQKKGKIRSDLDKVYYKIYNKKVENNEENSEGENESEEYETEVKEGICVLYAYQTSGENSKLQTADVDIILNNLSSSFESAFEDDTDIKTFLIIAPTTFKDINTARQKFGEFDYQILYDSDLMFNPTIHNHYNAHQVLDEDEKIELLKELNVNPIKLPIIRHNEAISKWFKYRIGDIICINKTNPSDVAKKSIEYRVVS